MRLLAFFDLDDLVGDAAMRLTVDRRSRFFAWCFAQTKDGAIRFVERLLSVDQNFTSKANIVEETGKIPKQYQI